MNTAVGAGVFDILGSKVRADIWHDANTDGPLEGRVRALENNLRWVWDRFRNFEQETGSSLGQQANALQHEARARADADTDIRKELKDAQAGGLHISLAGVVWLTVGVVLSTASVELACFARPTASIGVLLRLWGCVCQP